MLLLQKSLCFKRIQRFERCEEISRLLKNFKELKNFSKNYLGFKKILKELKIKSTKNFVILKRNDRIYLSLYKLEWIIPRTYNNNNDINNNNVGLFQLFKMYIGQK